MLRIICSLNFLSIAFIIVYYTSPLGDIDIFIICYSFDWCICH